MNQPLTTIVALSVAAIICFAVIRLLLPRRGKRLSQQDKDRNRTLAWVIMAGLLVMHSAFLFFAEQDRFFSATTGEPIRYYTISPLTREIQVFDRPIFDAFGQPAKKVTPRIAQAILRQRKEERFPIQEVPGDQIRQFFDARTGEALAFYYQDTSGGIHFFVQEGYDPQTGRKLLPVTSKIVEEYQEKRQTTKIRQEPDFKEMARREDPVNDNLLKGFGSSGVFRTVNGGKPTNFKRKTVRKLARHRHSSGLRHKPLVWRQERKPKIQQRQLVVPAVDLTPTTQPGSAPNPYGVERPNPRFAYVTFRLHGDGTVRRIKVAKVEISKIRPGDQFYFRRQDTTTRGLEFVVTTVSRYIIDGEVTGNGTVKRGDFMYKKGVMYKKGDDHQDCSDR
jgi:hypothetical protein